MILLSAAVALALAGCSSGEADSSDAAKAIPLVEAVQARSGAVPLRERASGTVRAENQVAIRAEVQAPVVEVLVRSGEQVRQGQPLVRLDDRELREQLRQAEASVRLAEAAANEAAARVGELESRTARARTLAEQALISRAELETLEAQLAASRASAAQERARIEQARATAQERRSALAKTIVRAPVAGRVGQRNAEVGMIAQPSAVLFLVGDVDELVVEIPLTQEMLGNVGEGDPVLIHSPALGGQPLEARLSRISPFLASASFSTVAEIDFPNPGGRLRPGMFVTVDILYGTAAESTLVPASAVWEDPATGVMKVFVVPAAGGENDAPVKVESRAVEVTAEGSGIAGVSAVQPGEWVVVAGQHILARDRAEVARVRRSAWERIVALQSLQREDLLAGFLEEQQRYARTIGAEPPTSAQFLKAQAPAEGR